MGIDQLLDRARARITRLTPLAALAAAESGGLIVDIRSDLDREHAGVVPGSVHIPRTVLEWRLDPECAWQNPHVETRGRLVVLLCDHGYSSSLAAASLVELGLEAADVIGGFEAWRDDGLPISRAPRRRDPSAPAGMGPAEP